MQLFDVFIFTETWLTDTIDSDELKSKTFKNHLDVTDILVPVG